MVNDTASHCATTEKSAIAMSLAQEDAVSNLKAFFDLSGDMFWVLDLQSNIIETNAHRYLGYQKEELIGQSVLMVHPEELRQRALEIVMAMLAGRASLCPLPLVKKDGSYLPVETRATLGVWNGQKAIFASSRDMSSLMLSEEKFSKAFNVSPVLMAISTIEEGQFIDVNDSFLKTLGFTREEVIGKTSRDIHLYDDYSMRDAASQKALKPEATISLEQRTRTKDGRWLDGVYTVRTLTIGNVQRLFTVMIDMTIQKEAEKKLREFITMEDFLIQSASRLLNADPMAIDKALNWVMSEIGKMTESDRSYIFNFNLRKRKMDNTIEWCAPGIAPQMQELQNLPFSFFPDLMSMFERGEAFIANDVSELDDRQKMTREVLEAQDVKSALLIPINNKDNMIGFLGLDSVRRKRSWSVECVNILRILSNNIASAWDKKDQFARLRTAMQRAREYARQAKLANAYKDEFLSTMSHEIRTPMNAVANATKFLNETTLDQRQQRYATMLSNSSDILLKIINDILDYSKISAGKLSLENERIDLRETVDYCSAPYVSQAEEKGLFFTVDYSHDTPDLLIGDQRKICQIIGNLLSNAIKFTKTGGIHFTVESVTEKNIAQIFFTIEDSGIGMSADYKKKIFSAFQQGAPAISREFGGSGLGLSIVKQLTNFLGGDIEIQSKENRGTRITVRLPLHIAEKKKGAFLPRGREHRVKICILGNDDQNEQELEQILHRWGIYFVHFKEPDEANLEIMRHAQICVCLNLHDWTPLLEEMMSCEEKPALFIAENCWQEKSKDGTDGYLQSANILRFPLNPSRIYEAMQIGKMKDAGWGDLIGKGSLVFHDTTVLVVEDNDLNIEIISEYLRRMNIVAHVAKSVADFFFQVNYGFKLDLILMDVQLSDSMDGYQLTHYVRASEDKNLRNIPIVAMTAHVLDRERKKSFECGMNDHLGKPIDPSELEKILRKWINKDKYTQTKANVSGSTAGNATSASSSKPCTCVEDESAIAEFLDAIDIPVRNREPEQCFEIIQKFENHIWPEAMLDSFTKIIQNVEDYQFREAETVIATLKNQLKG